MTTRKPITIVGGGLSGLALGIGLRLSGIPVTLWEAGDYPRQRVCGEFISGRGLDCLEAIGLKEALRAHSFPTETVSFFSTSFQFGPVKLPRPGLAVSRWVLDQQMSEQFSRVGGELKTRQRWQDGFETPGVVRSTGRRMAQSGSGKVFGVKVHAKNIRLSAGLEMHFTDSGYVGLCALNSTETNVCGLFRSRDDFKSSPGSWRHGLAGEPGSPLRSRMDQGELEMDSFCAVAALPMEISWPSRPSECRIGDAINMMPPVTGNGMSMALESAVIARGPLEQYSAGHIDWLECLNRVDSANHRAFAFRLRAAGWLHRLLFHPSGRELVFNSARFSPRCFSAFFALTR